MKSFSEIINEGSSDVVSFGKNKEVSFSMRITAARNSVYLNMIPKTTKDIDKLDELRGETDAIQYIQTMLLDAKFGKDSFISDIGNSGAGYWFEITDGLLDDVILKYLKA